MLERGFNDWSTSATIRSRALREWERGNLLAARLTDESIFPWRIALKGPTSATLAERFDEVRQWIRALAEAAKPENGAGYRLEFQDINHRQLGRNQVPVAAWLDTEADVLALIGKRRESTRFDELAASIHQAFPVLRGWLAKRPMRVLEHAQDWPKLLGVLRWMAEHPRPNVYLRQIDVPGVDSKFIENQRALLSELLDRILPEDAIDTRASVGAGGFAQRYGFRAKPPMIRFRLLDASLQGLTDLSVPAEEFAHLSLPAERVFITENEINFLAFPRLPNSMLLFGAGYGFDSLAMAKWLQTREIYYWGDIDSHGFAILNQLRQHFPNTRSLLMDRATLLAHRALWCQEATPTQRNLNHLHPDEASLYDDLRNHRIAPSLRLEQERIGFGWIEAALESILLTQSEHSNWPHF